MPLVLSMALSKLDYIVKLLCNLLVHVKLLCIFFVLTASHKDLTILILKCLSYPKEGRACKLSTKIAKLNEINFSK